MRLWNCEFWEKWDFEIVNFVESEIFKREFLDKMMIIAPKITKNLMFEKCEFCEKWDFENVNFEEYEILKNVNFVKNETFYMWIL